MIDLLKRVESMLQDFLSALGDLIHQDRSQQVAVAGAEDHRRHHAEDDHLQHGGRHEPPPQGIF